MDRPGASRGWGAPLRVGARPERRLFWRVMDNGQGKAAAPHQTIRKRGRLQLARSVEPASVSR
jgi:hypothetical protein